MKRKGWVALLGVLVLLALCQGSCSEGNPRYYDCFQVSILMTAERMGRNSETLCPVYAAPSNSAYRGADGKAAVSLKEPFQLLARTTNHAWWLIEYSTSGNACRVGWIQVADEPVPISYPNTRDWEGSYWMEETGVDLEDDLESLEELETTRLVEITRSVNLTDDPRAKQRILRQMQTGETVRGFFQMEHGGGGQWVYIMTEVDGKPACGFVPADAVRWHSGYSIDGDTLSIEEGIEVLGENVDWLDSLGIEYRDGGPLRHALSFGMTRCSIWDSEADVFRDDLFDMSEIHHVILPSTLKLLGDDALCFIDTQTLVIPEGVERLCGISVLKNMHIGTLVLPSTLWDFDGYCILDSGVSAYEVAKESPYFKAVEGVLFTKDGRKLVSYPREREVEHYDVPKGTEEIGDYAFGSYRYYELGNPIRLRALSLPIGLKKIGWQAFQGLDELVSLVIPLTVTEMNPQAFGVMASLEQLSMPETIQNDFYTRWKETHTEGTYTGDNGDLVQKEIDTW